MSLRLAVLVAGLCVLPVAALADGVMLNGVSARSIGRGGTNIAHSDNGAVLFDNPAGAVNIDSCELLDVGGTLLITEFDYRDADNPAGVHDTGAVPLPSFSYIRKSCDDCFAYGIGVFAPAGFSEKFDMNGPFPLLGPRTYKSFGSLTKVLPSVACRVTDNLSAGATLGVAVSHAELEGPYFLQDAGPLQGTPLMLDTQATGAALCWSFGLQYELSCQTTVGVTYQSESRFHLDGSTRVDIPLVGASTYDTQLDITWPQSLGVGVRHELCCCRALSCDVIWYGWSSAFDEFALRLTNPSTPGFPPITDHLPLQWRDSVSVRLGFEQELNNGGVLRLGYVHHRNPVPASTQTPYIQAILENGFSVGYGWAFCGWELDVAYMYTIGSDVNVGISDLIGGDFNQSEHSAETHAVALGAIWRY